LKIPDLILRLWKQEDPSNNFGTADLIIPISYSTRREGLVAATKATTDLAATLALQHRSACVVLSCCSYTFPGSDEFEWRQRQQIFADCGVVAHRADNMNNSDQEAMAIAKYVEQKVLPSHNILIVTGEMHSRSAKYIWKRVFPHSRIFIKCVSHELEWQPDQPVFVQKTAWRWFLANIARQILLVVLGLDRVSKLHHRSEK